MFSLLLDPVAILFLLLLLIFLFRALSTGIDKWLGGVLVLFVLFGSASFVNRTLFLWERLSDSRACQVDVKDVMILGGGYQRRAKLDPEPMTRLSPRSQQRLQDSIITLQSMPGVEKIIVSGKREAKVMARILASNDLPREMIRIDDFSETTWSSALYYREIQSMEGQGTAPLGVFTSALHMPRTLLAFDRLNINACSLSVDREAFIGRWWAFLPQSSVLQKTRRLMHELIGYVYYAWR